METRTKLLLSIRPSLDHIKNTDDPASEAYFQNEVLRPILKFQNDLFVQVLKNYFLKHKNSFYSLSLEKRLLYIENALQKDIKFRNVLKGIIIGQFSLEEYHSYRSKSAALNKRMMQMLIQRYQSQIQLFEIP
ncbi:glyoxalase [Flavobacteriaceae bacterium]|nr:glyoxalase [Flavobacteriaceae bacterium]MDA9929097.1 glyoxalase [Flavobacteriaceae bacterium]MDC1473888.1 glyoxalase [Flavobacteriaceae bacterium]MDC6456501.1 glyoxalase [Flavobacteriaceae bacterium]